jgi:hypothetical protein
VASPAHDLHAWVDFYLALASATAALLGLFFVVMSVRLRELHSSPLLKRLAFGQVTGMTMVLLIALSALAPEQSYRSFGLEAVVVVAVTAAVSITITVMSGRWRRGSGGQRWITAVAAALSICAFVLGALGGGTLALGYGIGLYVIMATMAPALCLWSITSYLVVADPNVYAGIATRRRAISALAPRQPRDSAATDQPTSESDLQGSSNPSGQSR